MAGYNFGLQQTAVNPYQGNNPGVVQSPFSVPAAQSQTQNMIPVMPVNSKEEAYYWPLGTFLMYSSNLGGSAVL